MKQSDRLSLLHGMSAAEADLNTTLQEMEGACHKSDLFGAPARRQKARQTRLAELPDFGHAEDYVETAR